MAKLKQSLRKMHKALSSMLSFVGGREEDTAQKQNLPTQRDQYYT